MPSFRKFRSTILLIIGLVVGAAAGYQLGVNGFEANLRNMPPNITIRNPEPREQIADFSKFWEVWDILTERHINRGDISAEDLLKGALTGLTRSLNDPYTTYLDAEQTQFLTESVEGRYQGIGAELSERDGAIVIVSPLEGSPAESAGIRPGDIILKVDDKSTLGMGLLEAVNIIRGPKGTPVVLNIDREGERSPIDIEIVRDEIKVESVRWENKGAGIAYIRIGRFGTDTNLEWNRIVDEIYNEIGEDNLRGLILDLRFNPGGLLSGAEYITEEFLASGDPILWVETADGAQIANRSKRNGRIRGGDLNIVVLIDAGSASGSEILAGALRDHHGAELVGVTSFGKGSIQDSIKLGDGDALNVTVARWLTPNKQWFDGVGLEPDYYVELPEDFDRVEDEDPQLQKALELAGI